MVEKNSGNCIGPLGLEALLACQSSPASSQAPHHSSSWGDFPSWRVPPRGVSQRLPQSLWSALSTWQWDHALHKMLKLWGTVIGMPRRRIEMCLLKLSLYSQWTVIFNTIVYWRDSKLWMQCLITYQWHN